MTSASYHIDDWQRALEGQGRKTRQDGDGRIRSSCPAHKGTGLNLAVRQGRDGVLATCHSRGCRFEDIRAALGFEGRRPTRDLPAGPGITTWIYTDATGTPLMAQLRQDPGKRFSMWRPAPTGGWESGGLRQRPLYRLPELAKRPAEPVLVVEGEKCADAARGAWPALVVTTWPGGASQPHLADWAPLAGRDVLVVADEDTPGRHAMRSVAVLLDGLGCSVRLALPDGDTGDDVADWLQRDGADATLEAIEELAQPFDPGTPTADESELLDEEAKARAGAFYERDEEGLGNALLALGVDVRRNVRGGTVEIRATEADRAAMLGLQPGPGGWAQFTGGAQHKMRMMLARSLKGRDGKSYWIGGESWRHRLAALIQPIDRQVDPVQAWLKSLPPWDGKERLPTMLIDALGVEDTPYTRDVSRCLLVGAVARTFEPGCQLDEIVVLIGAQGTGKSTFCRLLPPPFATWYSKVGSLEDSIQRQVEAVGNALIVEFDEMNNIADHRRAKVYLSATKDRWRAPYELQSEEQPRRWAGIGTANDEGAGVLPADASGNRRYRTVAVATPGASQEAKAAHVRAYLEKVRPLLWAEALVRYKRGEKWYTSARFEEDRDAMNQRYQRQRQDDLEEHAARLSERYANTPATHGLDDLLEELGLITPETVAKRKRSLRFKLGKALTEAQWTKRKEGTRNRWLPPALAPVDEDASARDQLRVEFAQGVVDEVPRPTRHEFRAAMQALGIHEHDPATCPECQAPRVAPGQAPLGDDGADWRCDICGNAFEPYGQCENCAP